MTSLFVYENTPLAAFQNKTVQSLLFENPQRFPRAEASYATIRSEVENPDSLLNKLSNGTAETSQAWFSEFVGSVARFNHIVVAKEPDPWRPCFLTERKLVPLAIEVAASIVALMEDIEEMRATKKDKWMRSTKIPAEIKVVCDADGTVTRSGLDLSQLILLLDGSLVVSVRLDRRFHLIGIENTPLCRYLMCPVVESLPSAKESAMIDDQQLGKPILLFTSTSVVGGIAEVLGHVRKRASRLGDASTI